MLTSGVVGIQCNSTEEHSQIVEALEFGDVERAHPAMDSHLAQTTKDLKSLIPHVSSRLRVKPGRPRPASARRGGALAVPGGADAT